MRPGTGTCTFAQNPTYVIDARIFTTLEGFYEETSQVIIPQAEWGRNLDAFNDIPQGGIGTPSSGPFVLGAIHFGLC